MDQVTLAWICLFVFASWFLYSQLVIFQIALAYSSSELLPTLYVYLIVLLE